MPREPPPLPISAGWFIFPLDFRVFFDRPLTMGVLDSLNWFVRTDNLIRDFGLATAKQDHVRLENPGIPGFNAGPDEVRYAPPPFDLLSDVGTPAAAFAFPF